MGIPCKIHFDYLKKNWLNFTIIIYKDILRDSNLANRSVEIQKDSMIGWNLNLSITEVLLAEEGIKQNVFKDLDMKLAFKNEKEKISIYVKVHIRSLKYVNSTYFLKKNYGDFKLKLFISPKLIMDFDIPLTSHNQIRKKYEDVNKAWIKVYQGGRVSPR